MDLDRIVSELTLDEKADLVQGTDFMYTRSIPRLGIPSIRMSDGPHGLRVQKKGGDNGVTDSEPATCFPTAAALASGWNEELLYQMGQYIAEECLHYGIDILLGPGVNIKRNPLCGRNFEYFSEDPFLSGKLGAAEVRGVQSRNVGVSVKHFALNNTENFRNLGDSICDERAMRELYLRAFERIVREASPHSLMCAYNKVNGTFCSENERLLTGILRSEWGYSGPVMSDWGATHDRVRGIRAGLDLEMPGDTSICRRWIKDAVRDGSLPETDLDASVRRILELAFRYRDNPEGIPVDWKAHDRLAAEIAEDCAVLLSNDGTLPLPGGGSLFITGELFGHMRYQGAGSSMIRPSFLTTPKDAFDRNGVFYAYSPGYETTDEVSSRDLVDDAVEKAKNADRILVFAGQTDLTESEGFDRETMQLPRNQLELIDAMVRTGKPVVVVLFGGSPVELPFADRVSAILNMYLPGQNGGTAVYDLLFGLRSPSGKLAETWPVSYADVPFGDSFAKAETELYKESVFVGYRYYLSAGIPVRYPFGYGLSYTSFAYDGLTVRRTGEGFEAGFRITNTGSRDGSEIAQLYVKAPGGVFKPVKELRGFRKTFLHSGESREIWIPVSDSDLSYYNVLSGRWETEGGEYTFEICSDCRTVQLSALVRIEADTSGSPYSQEVEEAYGAADLGLVTDALFEKLSGLTLPERNAPGPIDMESRFADIRRTGTGRILFRIVSGVLERKLKKAGRMPAGTEKENRIKGAIFLKRALENNTFQSMTMAGGKMFPYPLAQGIVHIVNGKWFRGFRCILSRGKGLLPPGMDEKTATGETKATNTSSC